MRAVLLSTLLLAGCKGGEFLAFAAVNAVQLAVQTAAEIERAKKLEEYERRIEAEQRERQKEAYARRWAGAEFVCREGRSYRLRCEEDPQGFACFYQTIDGQIFACPEGDCRLVPRALELWCNATEPGSAARTTPHRQ